MLIALLEAIRAKATSPSKIRDSFISSLLFGTHLGRPDRKRFYVVRTEEREVQ